MLNENLSIRISADISQFAEALRKFGEACKEVQRVFVNSLKPAFKNYLEMLLREVRTGTGPWYSRWYWRAAYATADRFPEWVSPD